MADTQITNPAQNASAANAYDGTREQIDRLIYVALGMERALESIAHIDRGPDRGSTQNQVDTCVAIADAAIKEARASRIIREFRIALAARQSIKTGE